MAWCYQHLKSFFMAWYKCAFFYRYEIISLNYFTLKLSSFWYKERNWDKLWFPRCPVTNGGRARFKIYKALLCSANEVVTVSPLAQSCTIYPPNLPYHGVPAAAWSVWESETKLMGLLGILLRGSKSSTWVNGDWWKEREKYPCVPWKESPTLREMSFQGGQAAGEAGQPSVVLAGSRFRRFQSGFTAVSVFPVPFPAAGKRSLPCWEHEPSLAPLVSCSGPCDLISPA